MTFTAEFAYPEMEYESFTKLKDLIKKEAIQNYIDWNSVDVKNLGNAIQVILVQHLTLTEVDLQFLKNIQSAVLLYIQENSFEDAEESKSAWLLS